jgi:hypothetical protein
MTDKRKYLLASILLIGTLSFPGCKGKGNDTAPPAPPAASIVSKSAALSGSEEVPSIATVASGSGTLEINTRTGAISGHVTIVTAPTTSIIASHLQKGIRGENGCILIALDNAGDGVWNIPAGMTLTPSEVNTFTTGNLYFNVRTVANPLGEIRGQIDAGQ